MARTNEGLCNKIEREVRKQMDKESNSASKNRTPAETWEIRAIQNGLKVEGKIYVWKPTKPMQRWNGRNSEKAFTQCVFALICANVVFIVFLFWFVGQMR